MNHPLECTRGSRNGTTVANCSFVAVNELYWADDSMNSNEHDYAVCSENCSDYDCIATGSLKRSGPTDEAGCGSSHIGAHSVANGSGHGPVNGSDQNSGHDVVSGSDHNSGYDVVNGSDQNSGHDVVTRSDQNSGYDVVNGSDQNSGHDVLNGSDQNSGHGIESGSDENSGCNVVNGSDQNSESNVVIDSDENSVGNAVNGSDQNSVCNAVNGSDQYSVGNAVNGSDQNSGHDVVSGSDHNSGYDVVNGSDQNSGHDVVTRSDQNSGYDVVNGSDQNSGHDVLNGSDQNSGHGIESGSDENSGCNVVNGSDQNSESNVVIDSDENSVGNAVNGSDQNSVCNAVNGSDQYSVGNAVNGSDQNSVCNAVDGSDENSVCNAVNGSDQNSVCNVANGSVQNSGSNVANGSDQNSGHDDVSVGDQNGGTGGNSSTGNSRGNAGEVRTAAGGSAALHGTADRYDQDQSRGGQTGRERNGNISYGGYVGTNGSEHSGKTDELSIQELGTTHADVEKTLKKDTKLNGTGDVADHSPSGSGHDNGHDRRAESDTNQATSSKSELPGNPVQIEPHKLCRLDIAEGNHSCTSDDGTASLTGSCTSEAIHREYRKRYDQIRSAGGSGSRALSVANNSASVSSTGSTADGVSSVSLETPPGRTYFLDARTFEKPVSRPGARIHCSLVMCRGDRAETTVQELLDELRQTTDAKKRATIEQVLLVKRLPQLADRGAVADAARVLAANEEHLRSAASLALLTMLLELPHRKEPSLTEELLTVVQLTQTTILEQDDDNAVLYELACLHLMAASALLTRCPKPQEAQCRPFLLSSKQLKAHARGGAKRAVLQALQVFYEHFNDQLERSSRFPVWSNLEWTDKARKARKEAQQKSSFCELVVFAFTFLNEITHQDWSGSGATLISGLADLHQAVPRVGKNKHCEDAVFVLHFLLLRGVVFLLNTIFSKDKPKFGSRDSVHVSAMTELAVKLIKTGGTTATLMKVVSCLAFHSVTEVRQKFNLLLRTYEHWLSDLTLGHLEHALQSVGFCRTPRSSAQSDSPETRDDCFWNEVDALLNGKPVEGVIYVPRASCMANVPLHKCMNEHPGLREESVSRSIQLAENAERHKNNFNNLLELSSRSQHIVQLLALQYDPVPFYITEAVEGHRLLMHLLECRHAKSWLPVHTVVAAARDIVQALRFLESRDMVCRDVTAYNMAVYSLSGTQKRSENVFSGRFIIKLVDLSHTQKYKNNDSIRPVRDPGQIPIRWTCSAALSTGEFSPAAMVFSMGCVLYELTTHGLQPFTSYDATNAEDFDTKRYLIPGNFKLNQWACIPDSLNDLIQRCTDPEPSRRPSLTMVEQMLAVITTETFPHVTSEHELDAALGWDKRYSEPCYDQVQRNHVPRKGIPAPVKQLIAAGNTSNLYVNSRKSSWFTTNRVVVTEDEFYSPDWIHFERKGDCTVVNEKVSSKFVHDVLPSIEAAQVPGVKSWLAASFKSDGGYHIHERVYARGVDLKTAAATGLMGERDTDSTYNSPYEHSDLHLRVFLALARTVRDLHHKGLLLRSLRAAHVLLTENEVILPRIGRIYQQTSSEHCHDNPLEDIYRWLGPEVLLSGKYGRENDVFLLVTVFWETMRIMELSASDPAATDAHFAPFADILRTQVVHVVRENTPLPCPECCDDWLYTLILNGRHQEPGLRPTAQEVVDTLAGHLQDTGLGGLVCRLADQKLPEDLASDPTGPKTPPQLPPRNHFQAVRRQTSNIPVLSRQRLDGVSNDGEETLVKRPAGPPSARRSSEIPGLARSPNGHEMNPYTSPPSYRPPLPGRDAGKYPASRAFARHRGQEGQRTSGLRSRETLQLTAREADREAEASAITTNRSRERLSSAAGGDCRVPDTAVGASPTRPSIERKKQEIPGPAAKLRASRQAEESALPLCAQSGAPRNWHAEKRKAYMDGPLCKHREKMYLPAAGALLPSAARHQGHPKMPEGPWPGKEADSESDHQDDDSLLSSLPSTVESLPDSERRHSNLDCFEPHNDPSGAKDPRHEPPANKTAAEQITGRDAHLFAEKEKTIDPAVVKVFVVDSEHPNFGYALKPSEVECLGGRCYGRTAQLPYAERGARFDPEVSQGSVTGLQDDACYGNELYESDWTSSAAYDLPFDAYISIPTLMPRSSFTGQQPPPDDQNRPAAMIPRHESHDRSLYLHPIPDPEILRTCYQNEILPYPDNGMQTEPDENEAALVGNEISTHTAASAAGLPQENARRRTAPEIYPDLAPSVGLSNCSAFLEKKRKDASARLAVSDFQSGTSRGNVSSKDRDNAERPRSHNPTGTSTTGRASTSRIPRRVSAPPQVIWPSSAKGKRNHIPGVKVGPETKFHRKPSGNAGNKRWDHLSSTGRDERMQETAGITVALSHTEASFC